jgi:ABC-type Fe3+-hydroxamate transport system substrate-binding protein
MGRLTAAAALVALALAATACGERSEPTGASVSPYPVRVQGAGDSPTALEKRPVRIAPLDPAVATMLIELNAQKQLVGLPHPGATSIWGLTGNALARALQKLEPDLIVASSATDPLDVARAANATRAPVYVIPETSVEDIDQAVTQLGLLTDHAVTARSFVGKNQGAVKQVQTAVAGMPIVRAFIDTGGFTTVSSRTLLSDLIRIGRGKNIAGPHPEPGIFDLKKLKRLDPQVFMTTDRTLKLSDLRKDKKTRGLSAVKNRRLEHIPLRYLQPDGDLAARLAAVARLMHPNALR